MNSDMSKTPGVNAALQKKIQKEVVDEVDRVIFDMFSTFNQSISKTNFYNTRKSTLAFRVEPSQFFSGMSQFDDEPYGISMIVSNDFRGFHIRFMPVARGGLRLIRSKNASERSKNITSLFKENYALALTQNKKNKDIPEFGSKGTILLEPSNQSDDAGRCVHLPISSPVAFSVACCPTYSRALLSVACAW
jgi:glutamate dehydrogenase